MSDSSTDEESVVVSHSFGPVCQAGMAKTKPSLVSIGTFWLISFARGANLSRRIASGFSVPSSPFIPCSDGKEGTQKLGCLSFHR